MALSKEEEGSENNAATNYFLYHSAFRFKSQEGGFMFIRFVRVCFEDEDYYSLCVLNRLLK